MMYICLWTSTSSCICTCTFTILYMCIRFFHIRFTIFTSLDIRFAYIRFMSYSFRMQILFIRFDANKANNIFASRFAIFASKRIWGGHPTCTCCPLSRRVPHALSFHLNSLASLIFIRFNYIRFIFACLYSLLLVIRFEANQSESDPFICFEANKYSLRYSLIFALKRISGTP